jgi:hypothetical protein
MDPGSIRVRQGRPGASEAVKTETQDFTLRVKTVPKGKLWQILFGFFQSGIFVLRICFVFRI